jgi:hypothetical protein
MDGWLHRRSWWTSIIQSAVYATVFGWPQHGALNLRVLFKGNPYLAAPVCSAALLGSAGSLPLQQTGDGLHLQLPVSVPAGLPSAVAYVVRLRTSCQSLSG